MEQKLVRHTLIVHQILSSINTDMLLNKLQGLVTNITWTPGGVCELFEALLKRHQSKKAKDKSDLVPWMMKMLHSIEINYITPSWRSTRKTLVELVRDETITEEDLIQILSEDREKSLDEIIEEIAQQKLVDKEILDDIMEIVSAVYLDPSAFKDNSHKSQIKRVLQKLVRVVQEKNNITPRLTQMVSWCLMALSKKGRLIQVSTGEGKTCIVAMFAAFRALKGEKVDIMSSSSVLAERDFKEWQNFYKALSISVSCNINRNDADLKKCYESQVVYGTAHDFAGDWLKHHFSRKPILGNRSSYCAIVDEVDSLMLDKGHHTVYLSCAMPALQHLNPLLARIWDSANQYTKVGSVHLGPKCMFHHVVLENITPDDGIDNFTILQLAEDSGTIEKGSLKVFIERPSLFPQITESITLQKLVRFFKTVEDKYRTTQFALFHDDNGSIKIFYQTLQNDDPTRKKVSLLLHNQGVCQYIYPDKESLVRAVKAEITSVLHFTPCDLRQGRRSCYVPGFLKDLVESKLEDWIENAFSAQTMTNDHEYVIESHGVVPVDYSCTGVIENFMQWSDGLHQFLQMKHQEKLSDMTAITNYMSYVGLLQMYGDQIYGVTGTLGHKTETETLQKIYSGITTCYIPTFKRRKLFEVEGVIVDDEKTWLGHICRAVTAQTTPFEYRCERAVLVICETIGRAKAVHDALGNTVQSKTLYIGNNSIIFNNALKAGQVIISTNLAGRGTDLRVVDSVNSAGGLFVVQTFLPKNARVEAQTFGQTGRQGCPGSAQLIICSTHLPEPLQQLLFAKGLLSLGGNMVSVTPVSNDNFEMQLRSYQNGQGNHCTSETLSQILTRTSDSGIKLAKKVRDETVAEELTNFFENAIPTMKKKQELFRQYLDFLNGFYQSNNNKPAESDLSVLHEFWGLWLLTNVNKRESSDVLKTKLASDLKRARETLRNRQSPLSNLHHYTLFGNELQKTGHFKDSILMYTRAIDEDYCWAAVAFYNRAFARLAEQDNNQDPHCIDQALEDLQQAQRSVELYCQQNDLVSRYSKSHMEAEPRAALARFDSHQNVRCRVFLLFKNNIEEAVMKLNKARSTGGHVKVEDHLMLSLAPVTDYLPVLNLPVESASLLHSRDQLRIHQLSSHSAFDIIHEFECLGSLGLTNMYVLDTHFSLAGFFSKIGGTITGP